MRAPVPFIDETAPSDTGDLESRCVIVHSLLETIQHGFTQLGTPSNAPAWWHLPATAALQPPKALFATHWREPPPPCRPARPPVRLLSYMPSPVFEARPPCCSLHAEVFASCSAAGPSPAPVPLCSPRPPLSTHPSVSIKSRCLSRCAVSTGAGEKKPCPLRRSWCRTLASTLLQACRSGGSDVGSCPAFSVAGEVFPESLSTRAPRPLAWLRRHPQRLPTAARFLALISQSSQAAIGPTSTEVPRRDFPLRVRPRLHAAPAIACHSDPLLASLQSQLCRNSRLFALAASTMTPCDVG